ncbi:MAG TPA: hypothetical protein VFJ43_01520 [Bacteroidia bacterium]|nr:hypothetical protein [Bacteroidia bacterium]
MIKAPFSISELDQMADDFYNEIQDNIQVSANIMARPVDLFTPLFTYLHNNISEIIKGRPNVLERHIPSLNNFAHNIKTSHRLANPLLASRKVNAWFKTNVFQIFNYDGANPSFTKYKGGELAYNHAARLNLKTCPYCNSQFTFTIKNKKYKTRPHFDHFYNKARYPYFALSFYNLIPSCYVCNSNLKGAKDFKYSSHIHPFIEGIEGLYRFKTNIDSVDFLTGKKDFSISMEPRSTADPINIERARKSLLDFQIEDRYNYHKDYAGEIIKKSYFYNNTSIKELLDSYTSDGKKLFQSEGEIIELILGNYIHESRLHKRILSKLTKDIAEEFGIKL